MTALAVQVGSTITNGSSAMRVTERVEREARWGTAGWRGLNIGLERFGGNTGTTGFVPDHLLTGWYHVPFEWRPCIGGGVEERYVWSANWTHLQREVRRIETGVTTAGVCQVDNATGWCATHEEVEA